MYYALFVIHVILSLMLCVVVLLQQSKGGGLAGAFGGAGAGEAMFGARGVTTLLHKATIYLAIAFMITSLGLVVATARRGASAGGGQTLSSQAAQRIPVTPAPLPVEGGDDGGVLPIMPTEGAAGAAGGDSTAQPEGETATPEAGAEGAAQGDGTDTQQGAGGGQ